MWLCLCAPKEPVLGWLACSDDAKRTSAPRHRRVCVRPGTCGNSPEARPAEIPTGKVVTRILATMFPTVFTLGKSACKDYW